MTTALLEPIRAMRRYLGLPPAARRERRKDRQGLPSRDPGAQRVLDACAAWLGRAQDWSASADGGVARHFSLLTGWGNSYPETTGYIAPTMLAYARQRQEQSLQVARKARERAHHMLDWLVTIQMASGGFQGGTIDAQPAVPVTFNTGQILLGLASGVDEFGARYRPAMLRAADWLVATQDRDGCWRRHPTPFAEPGEKAYETHVAWGLLEAARQEPGRGYAQAALANVRWALGHQRPNGWFDRCCLTDPGQALTHTLGYALRGVIEAYRFMEDPNLLRAAQKTADALLRVMRADGFLPGRLRYDWTPAVSWACLTGTAQIACCWLLLYRYSGHTPYRKAAAAANRFVRRTIALEGPPDMRGGVKGSFPVDGDYGTYQYLNWAAKFVMDAQMLELELEDR